MKPWPELKEQGIENILALRGDIPQDIPTSQLPNDFKYASDLVKHIQQNKDFSVGGACYPEGHLDAMSFEEDIWNLKRKASLGLDFLITQLFFDNETFYKICRKMSVSWYQYTYYCRDSSSFEQVSNTENSAAVRLYTSKKILTYSQ